MEEELDPLGLVELGTILLHREELGPLFLLEEDLGGTMRRKEDINRIEV